MRCSYRGAIFDRPTISLEVREKEIIGMYRGVNLYSRRIQTSIQPLQSTPRFMMKYRGNFYGKSRPQYILKSAQNKLETEYDRNS